MEGEGYEQQDVKKNKGKKGKSETMSATIEQNSPNIEQNVSAIDNKEENGENASDPVLIK